MSRTTKSRAPSSGAPRRTISATLGMTDGARDRTIFQAKTAGAGGIVLASFLAWCVHRRQTVERHRAQACRVRLRTSPKGLDGQQIEVANDSDQPVQAALIRPIRIRTERSRRTAWLSREVTLTVEHAINVDKTLWPGSSIPIPATALDERPVLYFSNARGYTWLRDARGNLREIGRVQNQIRKSQ